MKSSNVIHGSHRLAPLKSSEACAAVEAAHRRQLIHRDLKPENIFLVRAEDSGMPVETVRVLDFGVAKFLPSSEEATITRTGFETHPGVLVGTLAYMSPEQLLGERPSESWDLWALAVTAYETLTGALPFPVSPRMDWRQSILAGRFTPLSTHLKEAAERWQEFFASCFAPDRTRRPSSTEELLHGLESVTATNGRDAHPRA